MQTTRQSEHQTPRSAPVASFFSAMQLRRLHQMSKKDQALTAETHSGAFLFLDMVSFTQLGEQLSDQGIKGAEVLSDILHAYYQPILSVIQDHGGDVLFFAGDALGVIWLADNSDMSTATIRAAQCGLAIQAMVPTIKSIWSEPLAFRASIGVGPVEAFEVGGVKDNWMQLVRGQAIDLACRADEYGQGGTVTLSQTCATNLTGCSPDITPLADGYVRLDQINQPVQSLALPEIVVPSEQEDALSSRLTEAVHRHLYYPSSAVTAEFRRVTVLFADISGTDPEVLHAAVQAAQQEVSRFEGIVYQLLEDDKGTSLIVVFGLPGNSHADDHLRALLLARKLSAKFEAIEISPRLGIASGTTFCGPLGTTDRQQYSILGSSVNLAARLMSVAGPGQIFCDNQTRKLSDDEFRFEEAGWTTPKGFREPVPIFNPVERKERIENPLTEVEVVGRESELQVITSQIDEVRDGGASRLLLIRADAGMGKSALLQKCTTVVENRGLQQISGFTDAFETGTAYFAFRKIARSWCGIEPADDPNSGIFKLQTVLEDTPELLPLIPLLGPVLGMEFPETEMTSKLRGQTRSENTQRILVHLAQENFKNRPAVLLIEDGHWMDGASWAFLEHFLEKVQSVLVLLSARPNVGQASEAKRVLSKESTRIVDLTPITRANTELMIRHQLGVSVIADQALDLIFDRAGGNPLYIREIVKNLMETGDIQIRNAQVQLLKRQSDAEPVPDTLEGVITSRIDRLETDAQITIKAAAVLGRSFDAEILVAIHPLSIDLSFLELQLQILKESGFLVAATDGDEYVFHHALTRDAAYNLLSFAQRESLHHKTALALETKHSGNTDQVNARLGNHFKMAGDKEKAAYYLAAAGETALDAYASFDAIDLLQTALKLDEEFRGDDIEDDLARTHWCQMIGQAHYNQDKQSEAANWYRRAMDEAGTTPRFIAGSAMSNVMRAIFRPSSLDRQPSSSLSEEDRKRLTYGITAGSELGVIHLWESEVGKFALNVMNQVRVARIVGPTSETANVIAVLGLVLSSAGLRKSSERTAMQAVKMATNYGDLSQTIAVQVVAGMTFAQNGDPWRALELFEPADRASSELISGIWRHRSRYMLADALTWLGRHEQAYKLFLEAAELSHAAEPHTVALANAMAGLNQLRMGRPEQAVALLEGPDCVPRALECGVPFAAIMSLGVLAEARLALGQKEAALAAAAEAEAQITEKDDATGYYSSLFSYSSILSVRLQTGDFGDPSLHGGISAVADDLKRVGKLTRVASLGKATRALWEGVLAAQLGRPAKAKRLLKSAVKAATKARQPYELGRSLVELARLSNANERTQLLQRAVDVFERHNMPLELARARAEFQH